MKLRCSVGMQSKIIFKNYINTNNLFCFEKCNGHYISIIYHTIHKYAKKNVTHTLPIVSVATIKEM